VAPGDENTVLAKKAMRHKQLDDVDLVVVTGDVVDSTSVEHQSSGLGVLASRPSSQPVLVVPGNHDVSSRGWRVAGVDDSLRAEFSQLSLRSGVARQLSPNRPWPVRIDLAAGRCVVYGLDSTEDGVGWFARGGLGAEQRGLLDADLAKLQKGQRAVVVLHHHVYELPLGRRAWELFQGNPTMALHDRIQVRQILARRKVSLILHGHKHVFIRQRATEGRVLAISGSSTTKGCGLTGQRFFLQITLNLKSGEVGVDRVHYAPPARNRSLAEVFDSIEQMEKWKQLLERAQTTDDTFTAFANAFEARTGRLRTLDNINAKLDRQLADLCKRAASGPPRLGKVANAPTSGPLGIALARLFRDDPTSTGLLPSSKDKE
jgi:predicted phosphodiesterase